MSLKRSNERILGDGDGLAAEFIFITGHMGKNISITCMEHQAKNSSFDINETKDLKSQGGLRICKVK